MAVATSTVIATAAVVAATATVYSASEANKAGKSQRRARAIQQRRQELKDARTRRQTVQSGRLARARAISAGETSGAGAESSRVQGATGSVQSQTAANVSFLDTQSGLAKTANDALVDASIFQSRANTGSAIASISSNIFSAAGGFSNFGGGGSTTGTAKPWVNPDLVQ